MRQEKQLILILLIWVSAGILLAVSTYVLIPITLLLLQRRKMYLEMLMGFFVLLVFSDSRQGMMHFAADIKNVYLVVLAVFVFTDKESFPIKEKLVMKFAPFFIMAIVSMIFSEVILTCLQKTLSYFLLLVVVPNYIAFSARKSGAEGIKRFIWIGTLLLLVGFVLRIVSPAFVSLADRYTGLLGNPNGLGLFCIVFFILTTVLVDLKKEVFTLRERYFILGVILLSIVLSGSRNALFTVGIFMVFRYFYRISPWVGIFVFVVAVIVYQLLLANLGSIIVSLNLEEYFRIETLENASGRVVAWNFGWEKILESPLIGKGISHTDYLYKINYAFLSIQGHQGNAHNSFITFWLDVGLFGLLFYIIAFARSFILGAKQCISAVPALFAILFSAFFESWLTASLNPFTIQCVVIMTLISIPNFALLGSNDLPNEETDEEAEHQHVHKQPLAN